MDLYEIYKKEDENQNKIYLYIREEDRCYAYGFSAYLLTQLFNTISLHKDAKPESGTAICIVQLSIQFVVDNLSTLNIAVGDDYITIVIDDPNHCTQWKTEFDELMNHQQVNNELKTTK